MCMEMEVSMEQKKGTTKKGGFKTMPFIIANETFEKLSSVGLHINMIVYLMSEYHYEPATAAIILSLWSAISNFMPIFGAFLSDSYLGRFRVIALATIIELLGLVMLWLTTIINKARPPHCKLHKEPCETPSIGQFLYLLSSMGLMAIGAGGIRPCSFAFAADQINNPQSPKNETIMKSFFNWYYVSIGLSVAISATFVVYIQVRKGWVVGFGVTVGLMLFATLMFFLGSSLYVKPKPDKSLIIGLAQVVVAAWRNRHLPIPQKDSGNWYFKDGSKLVQPTGRLRLLNKACMIKNRAKDLDSNGMPIDPWTLCTVRQVEELKAVIKVLPIWSTGFMIAASITQFTFLVVQASKMNTHFIFNNFNIPPQNFLVFSILTMTIWIAIYDRILNPLFTKNHTKKPIFTVKQRMGIGIALSCMASAIAAIVERKRRSIAIKEEEGKFVMSAMWLVPQLCLTGLAEGFNMVGQTEFYYSQFPKSMSSIAFGFFTVGFGMGSVVNAIVVKIVKDVTQSGGGESWLSPNINHGHYDYYYGLLTVLGVLNFIYFCFCSWAYGSTRDIEAWDDDVHTDKAVNTS